MKYVIQSMTVEADNTCPVPQYNIDDYIKRNLCNLQLYSATAGPIVTCVTDSKGHCLPHRNFL